MKAKYHPWVFESCKIVGILLLLTKKPCEISEVVVLDSLLCVVKVITGLKKRGFFSVAIIKNR